MSTQRHFKKFKQDLPIRWIILFFSVVSSFGVEFSFDNPAVLKELLFQRFKSMYTSEEFEIFYSLIYSCLAIPNVIVPFVIGYLIDRLGVRNLYAVLAIFSVTGQSLVTFGVHYLNLPTIYSGRMVLGMACESMAIVQGIFLSQYFAKDHLSFVVGGIYCLANLGGVFNAFVTPRIAVNHGLTPAFSFGGFICGIICIMTLTACFLDRKTEKHIEAVQHQLEHHSANEEQGPLIIHHEHSDVHSARPQDSDSGVKSFPPLFWYICMGTFLIQASILSFNVIGASYITSKWFSKEGVRRASEDSGDVVSMFRFSSFLFSPILGYVVDKTGERPGFFLGGCFLAFLAHVLVINIQPLVPCALFGIAFTLIYTVCWPSVMLLVKEENVGKACGLITSLENVGLVLFPIADGMLKNSFGSYDDSEKFLAIIAFLGMLSGIMVYLTDKKEGGILKSVHQEKKEV